MQKLPLWSCNFTQAVAGRYKRDMMGRIHADTKATSKRDFAGHSQGFTLLETMIALALMALTTLALFQSGSALLRVSDRAVNLARTSINENVTRQIYVDLVRGLVPAWEENSSQIFEGKPEGFHGLSSAIPTSMTTTLAPFSIDLRANTKTGQTLRLNVGTTGLDLVQFDSTDMQFSYLGADGVWRSSWPPETVPKPGFFDDDKYMDMPQLPKAIKLAPSARASSSRSAQGRPSPPIAIVAPITKTSYPPWRDRLGYDN